MAYSATLAKKRGLLSDEEHRRLLSLFSKAGLSMDHHQFDEHVLDKGTKAILKTRDGLLRAVVPSPLGSCVFLNDVSHEELCAALRTHKEIMKEYPRNGEGISAFVDASDTGEKMNGHKESEMNGNGHIDDFAHGMKNIPNGHPPVANGVNGIHDADGQPNGIDALKTVNGSMVNGSVAMTNGH